MTRWGKAGVRLTPAEADKRAAAVRARTNRERAHREASGARARAHWVAGAMLPSQITAALGDLEGPEVDQACGVEEPTVDHWELGLVYPTWGQVLKLAELTGHSPEFICKPVEPLLASETSMRFHIPAAQVAELDKAALRTFLPEAIRATLTAEGVIR